MSFSELTRGGLPRDSGIRNSGAAHRRFVPRPRSFQRALVSTEDSQARKEKQDQITQLIKRIRARKHRDAYGSPRMHQELLRAGINCCRNSVAKYMRAAGLRAKRKINFRISTTNSNRSDPIAPNRLNQLFQTESINQVWLTDITYVRTREGFSYLCAFADLHSR